VLEQRLREIFGMKTETAAEEWTTLQSEKLHDLYWSLSAGGWWTERQWDRWDKRNALGKLKIHIKFLFESVKG
jgi:hypothetical protein